MRHLYRPNDDLRPVRTPAVRLSLALWVLVGILALLLVGLRAAIPAENPSTLRGRLGGKGSTSSELAGRPCWTRPTAAPLSNVAALLRRGEGGRGDASSQSCASNWRRPRGKHKRRVVGQRIIAGLMSAFDPNRTFPIQDHGRKSSIGTEERACSAE